MCLSRPLTLGVDSRTFPAFVSEPCEPGILLSSVQELFLSSNCSHKKLSNWHSVVRP